VDSAKSDLYKFIGNILVPSDFEYFKREFDRNSSDFEYRQMMEVSNDIEYLEKVYSGKKPNYRKVPPYKNRAKEIVTSALRKAGEEKVEASWISNIPKSIFKAYAYKLHDHEIKKYVLSIFEPFEFLADCCSEAFPLSKSFKFSNEISTEKSIKGIEQETNTQFESIDILCNGVKFHIFIIEYFSQPPLDSYKYVKSGSEPFSIKNHPFGDLKLEVIKYRENEKKLDPFWLVFFAFFLFVLFVAVSAKS
jgi:hypothetical protein